MTRIQPILKGVDASGELVWSEMPMPLWQILQIYKRQRYEGDFAEQWMYLIMFGQGMGWHD